MLVYALSLQALRSHPAGVVGAQHVAALVLAPDAEAARAMGHTLVRQEFPPQEGWGEYQVRLAEATSLATPRIMTTQEGTRYELRLTQLP
jgi:hypothetical protein